MSLGCLSPSPHASHTCSLPLTGPFLSEAGPAAWVPPTVERYSPHFSGRRRPLCALTGALRGLPLHLRRSDATSRPQSPFLQEPSSARGRFSGYTAPHPAPSLPCLEFLLGLCPLEPPLELDVGRGTSREERQKEHFTGPAPSPLSCCSCLECPLISVGPQFLPHTRR